jgi:hypothetical protein
MYHSVKEIGKRYSKLSQKRNDLKLFKSDGFFNFAKSNIKKYSLIEEGDDILVSTWDCNDLISDYRKTII